VDIVHAALQAAAVSVAQRKGGLQDSLTAEMNFSSGVLLVLKRKPSG
jgi:hypothetical protein